MRAENKMQLTAESTIGMPNVGVMDRLLRVLLVVACVGQIIFIGDTVAAWQALLALAAAPLASTAVSGWDPVYHLLGIRTRRQPEAHLQRLEPAQWQHGGRMPAANEAPYQGNPRRAA